MKIGKFNLIVGATGLLIAACGGLVLGATFDQYSVRNGDHLLSLVRFYLREGHSHGMPISLYNLIIGLYVDKLELPNKGKWTLAIAAACGLLLPVGLAIKGAAGAPAEFPPVGMPGVLGMLVSIILLLVGAIRMKKS
ncbi:hypothetical protein CH373_13565 [Leptospira perolatii]|uniref:DUF423 domain-containing protein n=1 Tax=Leptospira perolatii TaxID=2023191 RepID=A0A2M9ZL13_9LEPT|nr:hypothetical protein [Leptospira perolatii]PJZ69867.1 hypothetical protein CH360_08120 [Leptospira perolatii]PJZ72725.1 hypothetical protein CH373_13565 [Leptospira perolatii]